MQGSLQTVVCKCGTESGRWYASFRDSPDVTVGGETRLEAIARLLRCANAPAGKYLLHGDGADRGALEFDWQPPDVRFGPGPA